MPLLIVLIGVIILIFMIVKLKMNTFVGLVITSFIVGLLLGLPLTKIPQTIETGNTQYTKISKKTTALLK